MTAGRGCERMTPTAAAKMIEGASGADFDPAVVTALRRAVGDGSLEPTLPAVALPAVPEPAVPAVAATS
jgi:hypothetical protein